MALYLGTICRYNIGKCMNMLLVGRCKTEVARGKWLSELIFVWRQAAFVRWRNVDVIIGAVLVRVIILLGFHTFTGSDYTSALHKKGKVRPFAQRVKDTDIQRAFTDMAKGSLTDQDIDTLNTFTAQIYCAKEKVMSLNCHRHNVFEKTHGQKPRSYNAPARLKVIPGCMLPPCESETS